MEVLLRAAELALAPSVIVFMVGNLVAIGLETDGPAALAPLRDVRFLLVVMVVDWLFAPALAIVSVPGSLGGVAHRQGRPVVRSRSALATF